MVIQVKDWVLRSWSWTLCLKSISVAPSAMQRAPTSSFADVISLPCKFHSHYCAVFICDRGTVSSRKTGTRVHSILEKLEQYILQNWKSVIKTCKLRTDSLLKIIMKATASSEVYFINGKIHDPGNWIVSRFSKAKYLMLIFGSFLQKFYILHHKNFLKTFHLGTGE